MTAVTQYGYLVFVTTICVSITAKSVRIPRFARRNLPNSDTSLNSDPNQWQQCPCVRTPNGNQCSSLDSTMVATSLEDALTNFQRPRDFYLETETEESIDYTDDSDSGYDESHHHDSDSDSDEEDEEYHGGIPAPYPGEPLRRVFPLPMQTGRPRQGPKSGSGPGRPKLPRLGSGPGRSNPAGFGATEKKPKHMKDLDPPNLGSKMMCSDSSCKRCANYILKNLEEQTRRRRQFNGQSKVISELENMQNKWGEKGTGDQCDDLGFHFDDSSSTKAYKGAAAATPFVKVNETDAKVLWGKIVGQTDGNEVLTGEGAYFIPGLKGRKRRQTESRIVSETKINSKFEIQYKIDCRKKGEASESNSPYMGLCGTCWEWGMLPSRFYPQYVNMMTCNTNNNCLSGYGQCRQRVRNVQVLENVAPEGQAADYKAFSLAVPLCCDCQVKAGTALHNLVTG